MYCYRFSLSTAVDYLKEMSYATIPAGCFKNINAFMYPIHLWNASMPRMITRTEPIRQEVTPQELGLYPQGQRQGQGPTPQRTLTDSRTRISIQNPCLSEQMGWTLHDIFRAMPSHRLTWYYAFCHHHITKLGISL